MSPQQRSYLLRQLDTALSFLPERMGSTEARALLLGIGVQESRFIYRRQLVGPARGFLQFELLGGSRGVITHQASARHIAFVLETLSYPVTDIALYGAITDNDVLAFAAARLLLWTHPKPLPQEGQIEEAWRYYLDTWRPGKPHHETWDASYRQGWEMLK